MCAAAPILKRGSYLLSFGMLLLSTAPAMAIGTTPPSWKPRETVSQSADYDAVGSSDRMLAYDHHGNPGIAFIDTSDFSLHYARRVSGVGWVHAEIDSLGTNPSLAFDRYERPAISYTDGSGLSFAHFNGSSWQLQSIVTPGGSYSSLAFDRLGRPAISYTSSFASLDLMYIRDTDGDFSFLDETPVTVASEIVEGLFTSLVFDPLNRPMVAHFGSDGVDGLIRFSIEEPGIGWITTTVDALPVASVLPSIAVDPDTGYPAIAYGGDAGGLRYTAWDGNAWDITTVDSTSDVGKFTSLAFDLADGNPAISYSNTSDEDLEFAWHDGSTWQTQTVDSNLVGIHRSSLAFNSFGNGFPSIVYVNDLQNLFFIEDPPASVPEPSAMLLLAIGVALGAAWRKRRLAIPKGLDHSAQGWSRSDLPWVYGINSSGPTL